ncbi:NYN domain-containing protein [Ruegeria sp. 2205SS24-7]|uniref:NYN domain-containing protein n=1 Tax=Ruegeria discodermiae TaxID=3064389 RepID=UPI002741127C|nr:NYN domain-containing protein [Ruegeria sp. 2205SS24-7]MDP5217566.1 NYN domain-containing protein [Ruegeria sp. 2205SS24-7]
MSRIEQPVLAVLIDAENIPSKFAAQILKEAKAFGYPALKRVYGDWSGSHLGNWKEVVADLGMVARQASANTTGKNASDIGLVIDAMDLLHTRRFDGFVLVSSDGDFTALANRIREQGLIAIGIGEEKMPISLRRACNRSVVIKGAAEAASGKNGAKQASVSKHPPSKAAPLIRRAMKKLPHKGGWYHLAQLGNLIRSESNEFDPRSYGCSKLSTLLQKSGEFELKQVAGGFNVRPKAA